MKELKGTYVFKQNGIEIARSNNIITTTGKNSILQYLSGSISDWAAELAVGAMETSATVNDKALSFEIARTPVTLKSYKRYGDFDLIVVKGTIDKTVQGNLYEIGIFPSTTTNTFGKRDQLIITDFSDISNWAGDYATNAYVPQGELSPRVGAYSVILAANKNITNNQSVINLSSYSVIDTIDILAYIPNGSSGTLTLTLIDTTGTSKTLTYTISGTGYTILSSNITSDILSLSTINSIELSTTADITLDAIRVSIIQELTPLTSMVSRSAPGSPIAKVYGSPLDIEYYLELRY